MSCKQLLNSDGYSKALSFVMIGQGRRICLKGMVVLPEKPSKNYICGCSLVSLITVGEGGGQSLKSLKYTSTSTVIIQHEQRIPGRPKPTITLPETFDFLIFSPVTVRLSFSVLCFLFNFRSRL